MNAELDFEDRIREADHRIKNSLQMVVSMLALQARQSSNPELRDELDDASHRVMAVALLHEQLQHKGDHPVAMTEYLAEICRELALSADGEARGICISVAAEAAELPNGQAMALGLITSELVMNAFKHAYADRPGVVYVRFEHGPGGWQLAVADQGPGLAKPAAESTGFGLRLVGQLVRKLGGRIDVVDSGIGAEFRVTFPTLGCCSADIAPAPTIGNRAHQPFA